MLPTKYAGKPDKRGKVAEIGCGKGSFLELLKLKGLTNLTSFDTSHEGSKANIKNRYFDEGDTGFKADGIILIHTLDHIPSRLKPLKIP